ncbi:MAG: 6,7-dimethyl-8-ribityllumazine synthase [Planctomycetaceae bacterium]|jgi:6,7-dimethyl-8-ribityllumazine synthase|nr:6,7-dimethyl-8-ribityllumazine synthase [Planctomycetaceae bacterium]
MQEYSGRVCQPPEGYIVIVVSRFNKSITQKLLDGAIAKLRQHNVNDQDIRVVWTPGAYETPFVANYFAKDEKCLAVICLGAVIKGETSHDQHINRAVSMALWEISSNTGTPVIFGILTCDNVEQAIARSGIIESAKDKSINPAPGNKGAEAAEAALEMIDLLTELPNVEDDLFPFDLQDLFSKICGIGIGIDNNNNNNRRNNATDFFDIANFIKEDDNEYEYDDYDEDDDDLTKNIFFNHKPKKTVKKTTKKKKK